MWTTCQPVTWKTSQWPLNLQGRRCRSRSCGRGDAGNGWLLSPRGSGVRGTLQYRLERDLSDNLTGSITAFDAARRAKRGTPIPVVYASSAAVYGDNPNVPLSEDAVTHPLSAYGADKLSSELHGSVAWRVHGVPTCGLRFFNVYGPRQDPASPYSGVISIFCDRLSVAREIVIHGDGSQSRDFIFVGDVVRALLAAMKHATDRARSYNVCTGRPTTICDLVGAIADTLERFPALDMRRHDRAISVFRAATRRERAPRSVLRLTPACPRGC